MIKFPNMIKLLVVLAMVCSLVAIAAVPASAAAGVVLSPDTGPVGQVVTIQATGFEVGQVLTARFDGSAMNTSPAVVTVPASGNINFTVTIPVTTAGDHTVSVYRDGIAPIHKDFEVTPKVSISPTTGPVGTPITVTGTGFSGDGVTVLVELGGKTIIAGVLIDGTGSFSAPGTVPTLDAGGQTLYAIDGAGNPFTKTDAFTVTPTLAITPNSGLAGSKVTISGSGWTAGDVIVKFAGQPWLILTAAGGVITDGANKQIPTNYTAGVYSVEATDSDPAIPKATVSFTVIARPLTLTPSSGPSGTIVLITGSSMTPGGTIAAANLKFAGNTWGIATINIDSAGVISPTTRPVPNGSTVGANTVLAIDNNGLIAQGVFTVTRPTVAISPTSGPKGTMITLTGTGWLPGEPVQIQFAGSTIMTSIPDGNGNIAAAFAIPTTAAVGANSIATLDGKVNSAAAATFTVPPASITVSPSEGAVGTALTVVGSGFQAYTAVTVTIGGYTFMQQPLTDVFGAFSTTVTVPGLAPGSVLVSATDTISTVTAFFVIKAAAPTVQTMLAGISSKLVRVWGYSGGTWYMYDPADAAGSNLTTLTAGHGYWINVSEAVTLIYGGYSYALTAGWNLIGWR